MQLVDTNIFIDHFRDYGAAKDFFDSLDENEIIFSAISEAELIAGQQCNSLETKNTILQFMGRWHKVEVSNQIAVLAGDLVREHSIDLADALIAATALSQRAELLTRNLKHFSMIKSLVAKVPY